MKEQWLPIEGYKGLYEVSNFGEVKSLERFDSRGRHLKEKLLSPVKIKNGYLYVVLSKNGIKKPFTIHRLVYSAFVGEIPEGLQCNHIDENKENNRVENLNLMTSKQNNNWGTHNSRSAAARSKPVEAIDKITGRIVYTFPSIAEAERQGFCQGNISQCCRNCFKRQGNNIYKGFIWRYKE